MASIEERVSRLEGGYEHLATKADISDVKTEIADVKTEIADVKTEIAKSQAATIRWMIGLVGVFAGIVIAVDRLLG